MKVADRKENWQNAGASLVAQFHRFMHIRGCVVRLLAFPLEIGPAFSHQRQNACDLHHRPVCVQHCSIRGWASAVLIGRCLDVESRSTPRSVLFCHLGLALSPQWLVSTQREFFCVSKGHVPGTFRRDPLAGQLAPIMSGMRGAAPLFAVFLAKKSGSSGALVCTARKERGPELSSQFRIDC